MHKPKPSPREVPPQEYAGRPFSGMRQQPGSSPLLDRLLPFILGMVVGCASTALWFYGHPEEVAYTRGGTDHPLFTGTLLGVGLGIVIGAPLLLWWKPKKHWHAGLSGIGAGFVLTLFFTATHLYPFPPGSL